VTLAAFIAVGFLTAVAVLIAAIVVVAVAVFLVVMGQAAWMVVTIMREEDDERIARAVARERYRSALRRHW
jgi:uncharacterized membrane protein